MTAYMREIISKKTTNVYKYIDKELVGAYPWIVYGRQSAYQRAYKQMMELNGGEVIKEPLETEAQAH